MAKLGSEHSNQSTEAGLTRSEQLDDLDEFVKDEPWAETELEELQQKRPQGAVAAEERESLAVPEYADLLDMGWLARDSGELELDEAVLDGEGVSIDLADASGVDDEDASVEFDVGSLLTSLARESTLAGALRSERESFGDLASDAWGDAAGALHELASPKEGMDLERGDEEIGDDDRFPVFEPHGDAPSSVPEGDLPPGSAD